MPASDKTGCTLTGLTRTHLARPQKVTTPRRRRMAKGLSCGRQCRAVFGSGADPTMSRAFVGMPLEKCSKEEVFCLVGRSLPCASAGHVRSFQEEDLQTARTVR